MDSAAAKFKPVKIVVIGDGGVGKTSLIKWYLFFFLHLQLNIVISTISSQKSMFLLYWTATGLKCI